MRVLVVDAEFDYAQFLVAGIQRFGHDALGVSTGSGAVESYPRTDIVLLDLELPDMDWLEVCRIIRAADTIPIIALANTETEAERILALRSGIDDYLKKPSQYIRGLMARIEAVMRRARPQNNRQEILERGALRINAATRQVTLDDTPISVTRKEFELLHYLAKQPGVVASRQQLMADVWGTGRTGVMDTRISRTIDTHVNTIRRKLGSANWIHTVRGVGFRFDAERQSLSR
ncbi:DNA-binding response regulator, OmpR family, contains REC and winged-helix (wHTH) domain [Prauserella marina]|uniref:DNA-binding response regulator, OmpR family, contains REC and winged-helix (WHTH) domain n=1 Tax=Prauserella marina TaxID=530584 RepID=A0A1G6W2S2_9PSEU|nr:response regulator transcription factor [Prauserella marina]PWV73946.1 DNA-binding response OmpR family regulator [Prauserella marina]SDD59537.1 DNA-binding response regulator, OmpR family, contains REC and winged-helix (wHTH) domain [Prauserella marina]